MKDDKALRTLVVIM